MGKYAKYEYKQVKPRRWRVHPIWRGIGLAMIILVPILSYTGAYMLVRENIKSKWFEVSGDLMQTVNFAPLLRMIPELRGVVASFGKIYYLDLAFTVLFMVVGFGVLTILSGFLYRAMGPSRYGPVDAQPIRKSPTTSSRYK
jgi:hypothetical protein